MLAVGLILIKDIISALVLIDAVMGQILFEEDYVR